jgi:hypothetical protein
MGRAPSGSGPGHSAPTGSAVPADEASVRSFDRGLSADAGIVVAASLALRGLFLWFKGPRAFSSDLGAWLEAGWRMAEGKNPYLATEFFNWPPLWVQILYGLQRLARSTGVRLEFVITGFLIAVECVLIVALIDLLRRLGYASARTLVLVGVALNPVCVVLVCQHGNFDVLVALLALLAVGSLLRFQQSGQTEDWLVACLWLGLAIALKSVPVLLVPLLLAGTRRLRARTLAFGAALAAGPTAYGLGALQALRAGDVHAILRYRSVPGWFGATGWMHRIGRDAWMLPYSYASQLALLLIPLAMVALALRGRLAAPRALVAAAALSLVAVPAIGSGYGPQYFYWFWPLLLAAFALGGPALRRRIEVFAGIAAATYLVEYAFAGFLGAFLAMRFPASRDMLFGTDPARALRVFTLVRTPLWLAYLALLWSLAREVLDTVPRDAAVGRGDLVVAGR